MPWLGSEGEVVACARHTGNVDGARVMRPADESDGGITSLAVVRECARTAHSCAEVCISVNE